MRAKLLDPWAMLTVGSSMTRRWLISVSLVAHVALGVVLFATGVWRIEKLDGQRADLALAVMLPPAAPEGGPPAGEKPKDPQKQPPKKKVEDLVQPELKPEEITTLATAITNIGDGSGSHPGSGSGSDPSSSSSGCVGDDCPGDTVTEAAVCGNGIVETGEACDDQNLADGDGCSKTCRIEPPVRTTILPPALFQGLRISGDTQVHPSDLTKTEMMRAGTQRTVGTLKVCIAVDGGISSVGIVASTKYPAYDALLVSAARAWRYHPYTVNGRPMPACSAVTFVYSIK